MIDAVVIGSAGQDGQLLVDRLAKDGRRVLGVERERLRSWNTESVAGALNVEDPAQVAAFIQKTQPASLFFLAAFHHSAEDAVDADPAGLLARSFAIHTHAWTHVLEACRQFAPQCRLFYASSSHVFGAPTSPTQNEATPLLPINAYAITKVAGMHTARFYRSKFGLHASCGILYNHESPLRPHRFLSQRIVRGALAAKAALEAGRTETLTLGNLGASVDWGYAPDYIDAMVRITQLAAGDDFVIATGKPHTVQQFAEQAFGQLGLDWKNHVREVSGIVRKDTVTLVGDATKLRATTGWTPTVTFEQMIGKLLGAAQ